MTKLTYLPLVHVHRINIFRLSFPKESRYMV